jgi:hypothetical protein
VSVAGLPKGSIPLGRCHNLLYVICPNRANQFRLFHYRLVYQICAADLPEQLLAGQLWQSNSELTGKIRPCKRKIFFRKQRQKKFSKKSLALKLHLPEAAPALGTKNLF